MEQNTSNGPSKGSWRDKLGLGNGKKEMPKIADEFKPANAEAKPAPKTPTPSPRAPQPVTKLAPMAPRTPIAKTNAVGKPAESPAASGANGPKPAAAMPDSLAQRLKAQRQAAEKMAEQRISIAREKAEARQANDTPRTEPARSEAPRPKPPAPADKPKFTFADEELAAAKREVPAAKEIPQVLQKKAPPPPPPPASGPTVTPPRPALGGEKPIAASTAPATEATRRVQPQLPNIGQSALGYRPLDPPSFQNSLRRGMAAQPTNRGYPPPPPRPGYADNGFGDPRRREPLDDYRRRPEPQLRGEERAEGLRGDQRRPPARGRRGEYDDDMGDVFEDEPTPRRRANARDYNQAYQDYEEGYHEEAPRRRSSGPLLILLAILVVAAIFVTGLWYYYFQMKPTAQNTGGQVPEIAASDKPAKVNPEPAAQTNGSDQPAATAKKQIYDRILGEADTGGQMVPTEEAPKPIEPSSQSSNSMNAIEPVAPQPSTGLNNDSSASPIPEPAGSQPSGESATPEPLPLPPAPGNDGTQGALTQPDPQTWAAASPDESGNGSIAPVTASPEPSPPEPKVADNSADTNDQGAATNMQATPPSQEEPADASAQPEQPQPAKAKAKTKTAAKPKKQKPAATEEATASTTTGPLVLVAPSEPPPEQPPATVQPSTETPATSTAEAGSTKTGLFGSGARMLTGKRAENAGSVSPSNLSTQSATQPSTSQQVASIDTQQATSSAQPEAPSNSTATTPSTPTGGYVAQVASLRSEADARAELDRMRSTYGSLIGGLSTRITKATIAGSTRYRLGFGPLPSRAAAAKLCSSLIAAGERDCAVRSL